MSTFLTDEQYRTLFPIYGTCFFAGSFIATQATSLFLTKFDWRTTIIYSSIIFGVVDLITFFIKPNDLPGKKLITINSDNELKTKSKKSSKKWYEVVTVAAIFPLSLTYLCGKFTRYWVQYWAIPSMVGITNGTITIESAAHYYSFYDVGTFIGSLSLSVVLATYTFRNRKFSLPPIKVNTFSFVMIIPTIFMTMKMIGSLSKLGMISSFTILGYLSAIPEMTAASIVAYEIAKLHGKGVEASVAGFVNGLALFGTFLQPVTGYLSDKYGIENCYLITIFFSVLGVFYSWYTDYRIGEIKRKRENSNSQTSSVDSGDILLKNLG